jgi:hypothetical protein
MDLQSMCGQRDADDADDADRQHEGTERQYEISRKSSRMHIDQPSNKSPPSPLQYVSFPFFSSCRRQGQLYCFIGHETCYPNPCLFLNLPLIVVRFVALAL